MKIHKLFFTIAFGALLIIGSGCTKSSSDDDGGGASGNNRIRFLHAITEQPQIQIFINEEPEPRLVMNYGEMSPYLNLGEDRIELRLLSDPSPVPIFEENFSVREDTTMMFLGPKKVPDDQSDYKISAKRFTDLHEPFVSNRFLLRVVNASPTTERFDVYVFRPGVPIQDVVPRDQGVGFGSVTNYTEGNESQAFVELLDTKEGFQVFKSDPINFEQNPVVTIYLLDQFERQPPLRTIISMDSSN